jgi:separase
VRPNALVTLVLQGLLRTIFDLAEAYSIRGSVREAEFFLGQALSLSESLQAPLGVGRSLIRQAELKMTRGLLDEGLEMLAKAEDIVADVSHFNASSTSLPH